MTTGNVSAEALKVRINAVLPGWVVHFGQWQDAGPEIRSVLVRPIGGGSGDLVRTPQLTLMVIGAAGDSQAFVSSAAESLIRSVEETPLEGLVRCAVSEPTAVATSDGRAVFESAVSVIQDW